MRRSNAIITAKTERSVELPAPDMADCAFAASVKRTGKWNQRNSNRGASQGADGMYAVRRKPVRNTGRFAGCVPGQGE